MRFLPCLAAVVTMASASPAMAQQCHDLALGEPKSLTGTLTYVIYPGPPNYEDVQKGDTPEPNFVLRLPRPICLKGDPDFADPARRFSAVQVVETRASGKMRPYLGKAVTLTLKNPMAAETGHHHEPLVAWVTSVRSAAVAKPMDFTAEYGTSATTIRAFYDALHDGQGDVAARLIVPEKRSVPAFTPAALTRFYGGLAEPIRMLGISQASPSSYTVRYRYSMKARTCNGRAVVTTAVRGGRNFIQGIKPLDGC